MLDDTPLALGERLLAAGIPVVVCTPCPGFGKPGGCSWKGHTKGTVELHQPKGWPRLTAEQCDLSGFRPGVDTLAMVSGHGLDLVDVDTKAGGSVAHLPAFTSYGKTRTPSGGEHYVVPSSGFAKVSPFNAPDGRHIGDYVGGRADGTGRLLGYLPGSTRPKYPGGVYVEEEPWDIDTCLLVAQPDPALVAVLEAVGASNAVHEEYVDESPLRPIEEGVHPMAQDGVRRALEQLDSLPAVWSDGDHWDDAHHRAACMLQRYANSNWTGYTLEQAEADYLEHSRRDEGWGDDELDAKWAAARDTVKGGGFAPPPTPADDFAEPIADVWSTSVLEHIRKAAHSRLVSAPALLAYVLGRVLLDVPPDVYLPPTVGSAASLNLGVAVVGGSGSGKSALLDVSRELLGANQARCEKQIGSGEGLVQTFLRRDKETKEMVLVHDPRRLVVVDEVDQLGALGQRSGATLGPTIRSALTGGQLGTENADIERRRNVPARSYRLVLFAGVQPTRSAALLEDSDAGTPQRFVWVRATDPTIPDAEVEWPGELKWSPPEVDGFLDYPDHVKAVVRSTRLAQQRGGGRELDGHLVLLRLKVGAALALLHGETFIRDEWWALAGQIVDASLALQGECKAVLAAEGQRRTAGAAIAQSRAQDAAEEDQVKRAAQQVLKKVREAGGKWVTKHQARPGTHALRQHMDDAIEVLRLASQVEVEEYESRGQQGIRLREKAA
ncbi:hypothetical protein ABC795_11230 [Blastococcus sp. HT6-30]|uniref:hypothetical protein n=1 Tax=Blastococcus sp. HT6-30 TaxID=3144843 RepID=UPI00321C0431